MRNQSALNAQIQFILNRHNLELSEDVTVDLVKASFEMVRFLTPKVSWLAGIFIVPLTRIFEGKVISILDVIDGRHNR